MRIPVADASFPLITRWQRGVRHKQARDGKDQKVEAFMLNSATVQSVLATISAIKEARKKARIAQNTLDQELNATPVNEGDEVQTSGPPTREMLRIAEDQLCACEAELSDALIQDTACAYVVAASEVTVYRGAISKELAANFGDYQLTVLSTKSGVIEVVREDTHETFQLFIDGPEWSNEDGSMLFAAFSKEQQARAKAEEILRSSRQRQSAP